MRGCLKMYMLCAASGTARPPTTLWDHAGQEWWVVVRVSKGAHLLQIHSHLDGRNVSFLPHRAIRPICRV